ncbi:MAG: GNAT family protein [Chitinophagaceae bacterium]
MELQTERLVLKDVSLTDLKEIHQLHSLPETDKFNTLGIPATIQSTEFLLIEWIGQQNIIPRTSYIFCIKLIGENRFIGLIALKLGKPHFKNAEVWYKTHPTWWRKGYTTEALKKIIGFGFFNLGLHRIEAGCAVENIASIKTLEKVGMIREGRKREVLPIRGKWIDNYFYSILEKDLKQSG